MLHENGTSERVIVGPDRQAGQRVQLLIPVLVSSTGTRRLARMPPYAGACRRLTSNRFGRL